MNVYIITNGYYSDYHIVAVFSAKEDAERFCKEATFKYDSEYYGNYRIETYSLQEYQKDNVDRIMDAEVFCSFKEPQDNKYNCKVVIDKNGIVGDVCCDEYHDYGEQIGFGELDNGLVIGTGTFTRRQNEALLDFIDRVHKIFCDEYYMWKDGRL